MEILLIWLFTVGITVVTIKEPAKESVPAAKERAVPTDRIR